MIKLKEEGWLEYVPGVLGPLLGAVGTVLAAVSVFLLEPIFNTREDAEDYQVIK